MLWVLKRTISMRTLKSYACRYTHSSQHPTNLFSAFSHLLRYTANHRTQIRLFPYEQSDQGLYSLLLLYFEELLKLYSRCNRTKHWQAKGLILNAPITTKVVCFSRLLKCLRSFYGKQCGPRSDWVQAVCFYT